MSNFYNDGMILYQYWLLNTKKSKIGSKTATK